MKRLVFLFLLLFPIVSKAGTTLSEVPDSKYVEYGNQHKCVVKLVGMDIKNPKAYSFGSAVVIKPRWVVTAAHVVHNTEKQYVLIGDKKISIDKVISNPNFDFEKKLSDSDIALCHTTEDIILDFYPELYCDQDELNKVCSISGYGVTGSGDTGAVKSDDKKRAGSNIVIGTTDYLLRCDMNRHNRTSLEFLISHGDSGGGLFIDKKLAGINSFVMASDKKPDSSFGDESFHTRISNSKIFSWIEENTK